MVESAKFNIGGHRYEVARTLLEQHPETMLAKSASQVWQADPESEIFMERNGIRFQYVLDYLRDGMVFLPVTESKEALIHDLNYFGINAIIDMINDSDSKLYSTASDIKKAVDELRLDGAAKCLAVKCVEEFYKSAVTHTGTTFDIDPRTNQLQVNILGNADGAALCNHHLELFGLEMENTNSCCWRIRVQELVKK
jgi:hypothetical protein